MCDAMLSYMRRGFLPDNEASEEIVNSWVIDSLIKRATKEDVKWLEVVQKAGTPNQKLLASRMLENHTGG